MKTEIDPLHYITRPIGIYLFLPDVLSLIRKEALSNEGETQKAIAEIATGIEELAKTINPQK